MAAGPHPHRTAAVTLSSEAVMPPQALPVYAHPHRVAFKHRQCFELGAWRIVVTRVWAAASMEAAEVAMRTQPPRCELEVEVADVCALLRDGGTLAMADGPLAAALLSAAAHDGAAAPDGAGAAQQGRAPPARALRALVEALSGLVAAPGLAGQH
jgi:hypothetical protein